MKSSATGVCEDGAYPDSQSANAVAFQPGQPFNPYGFFHGIFIPEALVRYPDLTPGAKIAYGRLARYAGKDGACHPRQETLACEIGVSDRQVRSYLQELIAHRFLKVIRKGLHAPNDYVFLWHEVFSGQERKETSGPISRESVQESPFKESHPSSSSSAKKKTPPPTPSSNPATHASDHLSQKTDDDATSQEPKVEYKSEQHELIALIEQATGKLPDKKLIADILDRLKLREMSVRAYLDDVRPRLQRLKRRAGPGFSIPWPQIRATWPRPAPTNGLTSPRDVRTVREPARPGRRLLQLLPDGARFGASRKAHRSRKRGNGVGA